MNQNQNPTILNNTVDKKNIRKSGGINRLDKIFTERKNP